jgi:hypothetical protein
MRDDSRTHAARRGGLISATDVSTICPAKSDGPSMTALPTARKPLVVPRLHLAEIDLAFREDRNASGTSAARRAALFDERGESSRAPARTR